MSWHQVIGDLLNQYAQGGGAGSRQEAHEHYQQIAKAVPPGLLGSLIGPALNSLGPDQVQQSVFKSATEMTPEERGGLFSSLVEGLRSTGTDVTALADEIGIHQTAIDEPQTANPDELAKLAAHAHQNEPNIFHKAMEFYADHPTLVKVFGTVAVAAIAKQLNDYRTNAAGGS